MKPFVTVHLYIHGNDTPLDVSDYVDDSGKFVPLGTQVLSMLEKHDLVHFKDSEGVETIIPYHAVVAYAVEKASDEYTALEDEFCQTDPCLAEGTCNTSWTITFANGDTKLAEYLVENGETPVYGGATPTKTQEGYTCEFIGWNTDKTAQTALDELPPATAAATYYAIFTCTQN